MLSCHQNPFFLQTFSLDGEAYEYWLSKLEKHPELQRGGGGGGGETSSF